MFSLNRKPGKISTGDVLIPEDLRISSISVAVQGAKWQRHEESSEPEWESWEEKCIVDWLTLDLLVGRDCQMFLILSMKKLLKSLLKVKSSELLGSFWVFFRFDMILLTKVNNARWFPPIEEIWVIIVTALKKQHFVTNMNLTTQAVFDEGITSACKFVLKGSSFSYG